MPELNVTKRTVREVIEQSPLPLPLGFKDKDGRIHRTVEITEMTGAVDEAIADPKVRQNGGKIITEAINGVIKTIGSIDKPKKEHVRQMFGADREFLLLASFHNSVAVDEFVRWVETCRGCRKTYDVELNYLDLPVYYLEGENYIMELELPKGISVDGGKTYYRKLKVTFPNGEVQERVSQVIQSNPGAAVTTIISMCAEEIEGLTSWNYETFKNMVKKDRVAVGEFLNKQTVGVDMTTTLECPHCGFEQKSAVPVSSLLGE